MKIIRTRLMPDNTGFSWLPGLVLLGVLASESLEAHELRHKAQQARDGWLWWSLRYAFSFSARLEYEAEAYAVSAFHKCSASNWTEHTKVVIENEAFNLRWYNVWLWGKPSHDKAVERITHYFQEMGHD